LIFILGYSGSQFETRAGEE